MNNARALKFVSFDKINDHLSKGWMTLIPNGFSHHHHYGVEMAWLCECPVPGGFKHEYRHRVPATTINNEDAHGSSDRTQ